MALTELVNKWKADAERHYQAAREHSPQLDLSLMEQRYGDAFRICALELEQVLVTNHPDPRSNLDT